MDRAADREYGHYLAEHDHDNPDDCETVERNLRAKWVAESKEL